VTVPDPDLAALLPSWELALRAERKSPQTVKTYGDGVRAYLRWCDANDRPPCSVGASWPGSWTRCSATVRSPRPAGYRSSARRRADCGMIVRRVLRTGAIAAHDGGFGLVGCSGTRPGRGVHPV